MTSEPIEIQFTITRDEYVRAIRKHNKTNLHFWRDSISSAFAIVVGAAFLVEGEYMVLGSILLVVALVLLSMIVFIKGVLPVASYEKAKQKLQSQYWLTFSDEQVRFRWNEIDSRLPWTVYTGWISDEEFYILYYDWMGCSVIPRRTLSKVDDRSFEGLLQRVLGPPQR